MLIMPAELRSVLDPSHSPFGPKSRIQRKGLDRYVAVQEDENFAKPFLY